MPNIPAATSMIPAKRLLFCQVMSLYLVQDRRKPTKPFRLHFGKTLPTSTSSAPKSMVRSLSPARVLRKLSPRSASTVL